MESQMENLDVYQMENVTFRVDEISSYGLPVTSEILENDEDPIEEVRYPNLLF